MMDWFDGFMDSLNEFEWWFMFVVTAFICIAAIIVAVLVVIGMLYVCPVGLLVPVAAYSWYLVHRYRKERR